MIKKEITATIWLPKIVSIQYESAAWKNSGKRNAAGNRI